MARDPWAVEKIATAVGLKVWPSFLERASCDKKEIWLNGGWRGGKSSSAAFLAFTKIILEYLHKPATYLIWLVGPDYAQARPEYNYLTDWLDRMRVPGEVSHAMQGPLTAIYQRAGVTLEIQTKQAGDPTSLGSVAPDLILACEAGQFSEEAMLWLVGRTAEKNATIIWSGTFENEEGKAQFAWFEEASEQAWTNPGPRQQAFRLPTWENLSLYDSCSPMLQDDASLASWCPDTQHGELHSGLNHPMIRKLADQWKHREKDWRKRFGGEPMTSRNTVYEWAELDRIDDINGNSYLISLSEVERRLGHPLFWLKTYGGLDPGHVHPAGIAIVSAPNKDDLWVRNAMRIQSASSGALFAQKDIWAKAYGKRMGGKFYLEWGGDPVGLRFTRPNEQITPMTGTVWGREERASIVNSYAVGIDNLQHLYFDADNPGVRQAFAEAKTIHRVLKHGQWGYNRDADDLMAAVENAITMHYIKGDTKVNPRQRIWRPSARAAPVLTPRVAT